MWLLACLLPSCSGFVVPTAATSAFASYSTALITFPLETKIATACLLAIGGDALAQQKECRGTYDARRGASFVLFDSIYRGAFQHFTFPIISETFQGVALHSVAP